jgi:drug/metabolite transporter (DMT)-like permease
MIGVTTLFAISNKLTTAANAIVLQFTAPAFVIVFMAILYGSKPKKLDIITCVGVLFGVSGHPAEEILTQTSPLSSEIVT